MNGQSTEKKTHDEVVSMMSTEEDMIILMQVGMWASSKSLRYYGNQDRNSRTLAML